jgi:protein ImuB
MSMFGALHSTVPLPEGVLLEAGRRFTPRVESLGPSAVLLDLRGLARMWPDPDALGTALFEAAGALGGNVHVALAGTRVAALVAARGRSGLTVIAPGREAATLAPLPLVVLDLTEERRDLFRSWGLRTLGDLARLPGTGLAQRLGPEGPRLRRLALGEDDVPLVASPAAEAFECTLELEWPVDGLEPFSFLLARVLEPLCGRLKERGRRAAALGLDLALVDGSRYRRRLKPAAASAEPRTWRTLLLLDLEAHPPPDAIQALTVSAEPTAARTVQFSLLDPAQPSPERLAEMLARLGEWTAAGRAGAPALLDTHRPGAFVMTTFAPGPLARCSGDGASRVAEAAPAMVPRLALRAYRPPLPCRVTLRAGVPVFVAGGPVRGAVLDHAGPWRASGDWWDVAWSREEWDVSLGEDGAFRMVRIYHDRLREEWFVEGELD